jgi:hypothetical protein
MPTRRTPNRRGTKRRITPQAIAAWKACDFHGLHDALGLAPFEQSPLPEEVTALGVSEDSGPRSDSPADPWAFSWQQAIELQRELYEVAGPPDAEALRRAYTKNLADDEEMLAYYRNDVRDEADRRQNIRDWEERVAWRRALIAEIEAA